MYAAQRGLSVAVVDRADQFGGLAGSIVIGEQSVDIGSHRLHPSIDPDLLRDLREVLGVELQWRPRRGRIRMLGRWLAFPLRPLDIVRHASPSFAAGVVGDAAMSPFRRRVGASRAGAAPSFSAQVRLRLGPTIARSFYEPYARKLWGLDGDQLSADLFRRRVTAASPSAVVRKMMGGRGRGFWYPTSGFGTICTALADEIVRRGGVVHMGTLIESLDLDEERVQLTTSAGCVIEARTVISTIPSASLVAALRAPGEVVDAAGQLAFRGAVLVYLTVPLTRYTPFDAHYFPEASTIVSRLSEPKNYRSSANDPQHHTVLCAEVPAAVGDDIWLTDDDELVARVRRELMEQGLADPTHVAGRVERRSHVYPIYHRGFEQSRRHVEAYLDLQPSLAVLGRQALFAHDNTHHALLMGKMVVEALDSTGRLERERWNAIRRSFDDHVVED